MSQKELLKWYGLHSRDLPWRNSRDPYKIWLSEVILQQTRVNQGLPYFLKFFEKYPQVELMARAPEEEIMKLWQGLGYYSRARNMHHTAKIVLNRYQGQFPSCYKELITLKGIGSYTAAAIASFAYDEPVAVLDGNVFRVLSRYFAQTEPINSGAGKRIFTELAEKFLYKKDPATHNQAMMELGSLVCTPKNPDCPNCPLQNKCKAFEMNLQESLPQKEPKRKAINRYFSYLEFSNRGKIALIKRGSGDIWQHLFDFPLIESDASLDLEKIKKIMLQKNWIEPNHEVKKAFEIKHVLTHQIIHASFFKIPLNRRVVLGIGENWYSEKEMKQLAIPRLLDKFINR